MKAYVCILPVLRVQSWKRAVGQTLIYIDYITTTVNRMMQQCENPLISQGKLIKHELIE